MSRSTSSPGSFGEMQSCPVLRHTAPSAFLAAQLQHPQTEARRALALRRRAFVKERRADEDVEFWGAKGAAGFRTYLTKKYGSIVAGWRALDIDGNGRLSFQEFCLACRRMGYHGNLKMLWEELDSNGNHFISMGEIDPEAGHMVGEFKLALMNKYGDMLTAWRKGLDVNGTGRIEEAEVGACCKRLGLLLDSKKLFNFLRCSPGPLGLTLSDFDPEAHQRWVTSDFRGLNSKGATEFLEDIKGIGVDVPWPADVLAHRWKTEGKTPSKRELWRQELVQRDVAEVKGALEANTRLRVGLHTVDGFKKALVDRCGSLFAAWRYALDLDENGKITFGEFCLALHRLGFHGDVQGLWRLLDAEDEGCIRLRHLDPETDVVLSEFRQKCIAKYGNMLLAWVQGLALNGNGCADEAHFVRVCKDIGFVGAAAGSEAPEVAAQRLFALLKPEAGRKFLSLKDLDVKAHRALHRGDFRMLSEISGAAHPASPSTRRASPLNMSFDERMEGSFFFQMKRSLNASQRTEFAKVCRSVLAPEADSGEPEDLRALCRRKFGSVMAAWRLCLDPDLRGRLSFGELCVASRRLGFTGDLKDAMNKYDTGKKGYVVLRDLDEEADAAVKGFTELVDKQFGSLSAAWAEGLKKDLHSSANLEELTELCRTLKCPHNVRKLFECLQPMVGAKGVSFWDVEPIYLATLRLISGRATPSKPRDSLVAQRTLGPAAPAPAEASPDATAGQRSFQTTLRTPALLRQMMSQLYGSTVAAWCIAFDPHYRGFVTQCQFCAAMPKCEIYGNVQGLWDELAKGADTLPFKGIDERAQGQLDAAREHLLGRFRNLAAAWRVGLDASGVGRLDAETFEKACWHVEMPDAVKPKSLFKLLLARLGQRSLCFEDLRPLVIGVDPKEQATAWGAALTFSAHGALATSPSAREVAEKVLRDFHNQDIVINTFERFKNALIVKFGSPLAAWRNALDLDGNGVVTQKDFSEACRRLGVQEVKKVWAEIDTNVSGQILLQDFHSETASGFKELEECLVERFVHPREGWTTVFDKEGLRRCNKSNFIKGCKELGLSVDPGRLFHLLLPEPGQSFLAYDDLWHDLNRNVFQTSNRDLKSPMRSTRLHRSISVH